MTAAQDDVVVDGSAEEAMEAEGGRPPQSSSASPASKSPKSPQDEDDDDDNSKAIGGDVVCCYRPDRPEDPSPVPTEEEDDDDAAAEEEAATAATRDVHSEAEEGADDEDAPPDRREGGGERGEGGLAAGGGEKAEEAAAAAASSDETTPSPSTVNGSGNDKEEEEGGGAGGEGRDDVGGESSADAAAEAAEAAPEAAGAGREEEGDGDRGGRSSSTPSAQIRRGSARDDWARATTIIKRQQNLGSVVATVQLQNKIGTKAEDLDVNGDDKGGNTFLKVVGLALQRALRDFGKADVAEGKGVDASHVVNVSAYGSVVGEGEEGVEVAILEGVQKSPDIIEFPRQQTTTPTTFISSSGNGSSLSSSMRQYSVKQPPFTCHRISNSIFRQIRSAFGISERQYHAVFGLQDRRSQSNLYVIGSGDAAGKSPSFFFLSPDQRYILKSCTKKDVSTLVDILGRYRNHVERQREVLRRGGGGVTEKKSTSKTLLPRYLGLYRLDFDDPEIPSVVVVAMTNFFGGAHEIHKKFDLKGSTNSGRLASEKERQKKSPVLKDLDWLEEGRKLRFPTKYEMDRVLSQMKADTTFLCREKLIDYSLLVGLHNMTESDMEAWRYDTKAEAVRVVKAQSDRDRTIAYYGIVDVLTPYGWKKRGETVLTGTLLCCRDVSCQPPSVYRRRFIDFCEREILAFDD